MSLTPVVVEFSTIEEAIAKMPALSAFIEFVMVGQLGSYSVAANTTEQYTEAAQRAFEFLSLSQMERKRKYPPIPCRKN